MYGNESVDADREKAEGTHRNRASLEKRRQFTHSDAVDVILVNVRSQRDWNAEKHDQQVTYGQIH